MTNIKEHENKSANNGLWIIYIIIFSTILIPDIRIKGIPAFRIEQIAVFIYFMYMFFKLMLKKKVKVRKAKFIYLYAGFCFIIVLSILVGSLKRVKVLPNDFFELYKVLIYLGIYIITSLTIKSENNRIIVLNFIIFCLLISVIIATQQYFNLFGFNERYVPIIAPTQFRTLVNNYPYPRVIGMTSNPNVYAVMPGIGAIISWGMYLTMGEKKKLLYMIIFTFGVLMTLSRSGFIFMASGIITFTFLYLFKSIFNFKTMIEGRINLRILKTLILSVFFLIICGFIILNYLPEELTWRLISGINIKSDNSFQARLSNWEEHIYYFKMSPLLGVGPDKSVKYVHAVDSEWILFLKRYGIIGCFYIIFTFSYPFINAKDNTFKYIYLSILVGCALYMIPAAIYSSFQLMPLVMIIAGLISDGSKLEN